jgi:ABC-type multidrug transport system permease subunit
MRKFFTYLSLVFIAILLILPVLFFIITKGFYYLSLLVDKYTQYINLFFNDIEVSSSIAAVTIGFSVFIFIASVVVYFDLCSKFSDSEC